MHCTVHPLCKEVANFAATKDISVTQCITVYGLVDAVLIMISTSMLLYHMAQGISITDLLQLDL